jgi:DNA-binding NarL/FixJ family response regulator
MIAVRVLLVDDNPTFLRIATRYLEEHEEIGVVASLSGGTEALASVEELRPDVALIDLAMPDLPGLEVIPRLRAARPELGIIALTLMDADGYRRAALAAGADEFVPKATMITELIPAIRRAAEASRLREVTAGTRHSGAPVTKEPWPDRSAS